MRRQITDYITEYSAILNLWDQSYENYADSRGLSYTSLSILSFISENPNSTQKMISEQRFLPKQTVNSVITGFLKKGWVTLEELSDDRRNKVIRLTDAGNEAVSSCVRPLRMAESAAMESLSEEQREMLLAVTRLYAGHCHEALKKLS